MHPFYDSLIFLYLIASATFAMATFRDRKIPGKWEHRHPRATLTVFLLLCLSAAMVFWGSFIEPRLITINRVAIDLPNFEPTEPVRAALISDVHVGTYKKGGWVRRVSARIAQENPDLVLIAGDLIVEKPEHAQYLSNFPPYGRSPEGRQFLVSSFPTYAVLGDHDYHVNRPHYKLDENLADTVHKVLTETTIEVLHNETRAIKMHEASFTLVGLDDWLAGKTDMARALETCHPRPDPHFRGDGSMDSRWSLPSSDIGGGNDSGDCHPNIVLVHNPDFILDSQSKNADLILAGNTHGGQIRLPFIGSVARLPSQLPRSFDEGLFDLSSHPSLILPSGRGGKPISPPLGGGDSEGVQKRFLFITSGISESGPRARLFNPPEIVILELH